MTEVLVLLRRAGEGVNVFEMRRGSVQAFAVDDQVLVIADAHVLAGKATSRLM